MSLTKKQRTELKAMFDGRCAYCGCELGARWHADHVEALMRKGEWVRVDKPNQTYEFKATGEAERPENERPDNYMPSCVKCNLHKGTLSVEAFRGQIARHIERLNTHQRFSYYQHAKRFGLIQETIRPIVFHFEAIKPPAKPQEAAKE
jgi:hypothetical protein